MQTSRNHPRPTRSDPSWWREAMLLDDLLDGYVHWRDSARAAAEAYARWSIASRGAERAKRFAAYTAMLDQEEKTAAAYSKAVTDLERFLQRDNVLY